MREVNVFGTVYGCGKYRVKTLDSETQVPTRYSHVNR
jgi:hypothetical protein